MTEPDPHRLSRFLEAQARNFGDALGELEAGRKRSHWMWYVFPQLAGLGLSPTALFYGIGSLDEARAYLAHPVLGPRLLATTRAVLSHPGRTLAAIFGSPDDMKFRSSMTLFDIAAIHPAPHAEVLANGQPRSTWRNTDASFEARRRRAPQDEEGGSSPFRRALDAFCASEADPRTLALLAQLSLPQPPLPHEAGR